MQQHSFHICTVTKAEHGRLTTCGYLATFETILPRVKKYRDIWSRYVAASVSICRASDIVSSYNTTRLIITHQNQHQDHHRHHHQHHHHHN